MEFKKITESDSNHQNLEKKSIEELLLGMHAVSYTHLTLPTILLV